MTKLTRCNLNRNVKSTTRKPRLRTVKEDYDQHRYDGSDPAAHDPPLFD